MTTCLINDQINDKRKMSILSEDTLLESGTLFKKKFPKPKFGHML